MKTQIVDTSSVNEMTNQAMLFMFGGLVKSGVTPAGGSNAGRASRSSIWLALSDIVRQELKPEGSATLFGISLLRVNGTIVIATVKDA